MLAAAIAQKVEPQNIVFIDAVRCLKSAWEGDRQNRFVVSPHRPDRVEPRVKKSRPKIYRLLIKPRPLLMQERMGKQLKNMLMPFSPDPPTSP